MEPRDIVARAQTALRRGPALHIAVLFGSHARGHARPDSDVDIAVIPQESSISLWDEGRIASELEAALGRAVDLVRLDLAPTLVRWEVVRSGIVLIDEPAGEWTKELVRVMAEHADYAPAAERVARFVLRHLADSGAS